MLFWAQRPCSALQICLASACVAYWNTMGRKHRDGLSGGDPPWTRGLGHSFQWESNRVSFRTEREGKKARFNYSASTFSDFYCTLGLCWPRWLGIDPKISIADYLSSMFNTHTATFFNHAANFTQFPQPHDASQRQEKKYCHALLLAWRKC